MPAEINYANAGESNRPSPSLWRDCPKTLLNDLGLGVFAHEDFLAEQSNATPADGSLVGTGVLAFKGDTDTSIGPVADHRYGAIELETDSTAGDAGALVSRVFGRIVRNSGQKLWFEAYVAPGDVDDDMGTFVGLVEEDGADHDIIADDPATNASLATESLIGYFQNNADADAYNAVYRKDDGDVVEVLDDVTNATAIDSDDRASLTDLGYVKLGIRFGGRDKLEFYVNGVKVAEQDVDSTIDQSADVAAIVALKTGDAAAEKLQCGWVRYAFQERS